MTHLNNNGIYKIKSSQNIRLDDDISRQAANSQMQTGLNQNPQQQYPQPQPTFYAQTTQQQPQPQPIKYKN
jgi:ribosomal 50S subunit-recycling heat shock protein